MRNLVAGGAGFIGSHLVGRLLDTGDSVTVIDNFVTGRYENLAHLDSNRRLRVEHVDLAQPVDVTGLGVGFDRIFNLASPASPKTYRRHPIPTHMVNALGTHSLLRLAHACKARYLQASTSEVYGEPQVHPQHEGYWGSVNPTGLRSCYDEGKRFAESLTMEFVRELGVDARIIRIFNTYGPRSDPADGRVVPNFCVQALRGESLTVYGSGQQTRSFCYVEDLVDAILAVMLVDGARGEVINLGNPDECTVLHFAERVLALSSSNSSIVHAPLPADDPTRRCPDITKARRLLGWSPRVPLDEGLVLTLDYFRERVCNRAA